MKKQQTVAALAIAVLLGIQTMPLHIVQAAQMRVQETGRILEEALQDLENDLYAEGEALVSLEATQAASLVREGIYRLDPAVTVANVYDFGQDPQTGRGTYIVHLTSKTYTTEELMELALKQYYVDGVSANCYQQLQAVDPFAHAQWYLDGAGTKSEGIRFSKQTKTDTKAPVIAVMDTGVNYNHPDLIDSMWVNPYQDILPGIYGYDFADNDEDPMDHNGHGTHVAGIAAAGQNNGVGITGASNAKIMALKIARDSDDSLTEAAIIAAYDYVYDALEAGVYVKAVNCSWGGSRDRNGILARAVNAVGKLGALSVFSAGNDGINWDAVNRDLATPYDLNSPYTVIVGASDENDSAAYFSDYGAKRVDIFAPGSRILSTYTKDMYMPAIYNEKQQKKFSVYYNQFSNSKTNILSRGQTWKDFYTAEELGIPTSYDVNAEQVKQGDNGFLKLSIMRKDASTASENERAGSIYVDVTELNLDQDAIYYVAYMEGLVRGGRIEWENGMMVSSPENSRFAECNGRTYMRIIGEDISPTRIGIRSTWYLDDIAISAPDLEENAFGAYAYSDGTSMAAPLVSAAVASISARNPNLTAKNVKTILMQSVRKVSALSNKCMAGGIVDASKFCTLATKVTLNKTNATLTYGKPLTLKAKVLPSNVTSTKVTWKSSNTKYATVSSKGVVKAKKAGIGHTVKITATAVDGSKKQAVCKIKIKK